MDSPLLTRVDVEEPVCEYDKLLPVQRRQRIARPVVVAAGVLTLLGVAVAIASVAGLSPVAGASNAISALMSYFYGEKPISSSFAGFPGTGLNLATGEGKLPFVAIESAMHSCVVDGDTKIEVSNSVDCKALRGKTFPERHSYVFNSYKDYDSQVNRWRSKGTGVGGFFVWTDDVRQVYRDYFAADLAVVVVQQEHPFLELKLNQAVADRKLSDRAAAAVEALSKKEKITPEDKEEFIRNFGTSYVSTVQMGGLVELRVFLKKSVFLSMSAEAVAQQAQKDFERVLKIDTSHILDKAYVDSRVGQSSMLWGGRPDLSGDERTLENWLKTVPENPAALEFESEELNPIVATEEKDAVVGVVNSYLDKWASCREKGCLSHGTCNEAGQCVCDSPFSGQSCEVIAKSRGQFTTVDVKFIEEKIPSYKGWVAADVNGDKLDDLVNFMPGELHVALALGDNRFKLFITKVDLDIRDGFQKIRKDVNNDGYDDIVALSANSKIMTYISNGDGTFKSVESTAEPINFSETGDSDFCFSSKINPSMIGYNSGTLYSYIPSGDAAEWSILGQVETHASPLHIGDFNGDGFSDTLSLHQETPGEFIQINFGFGNGSYTGVQTPAPSGGIHYPTSRRSVVVMDVNSDGKDDFVAISSSNVDGSVQTTFTTFIGVGDGTFDIRVQVHSPPVGTYTPVITQCVSGDFDNDGHVDLLCACELKEGTMPLLIAYSQGDGHYDFVSYVDKTWNVAAHQQVSYLDEFLIVGKFNGATNAHGVVAVFDDHLHALL